MDDDTMPSIAIVPLLLDNSDLESVEKYQTVSSNIH